MVFPEKKNFQKKIGHFEDTFPPPPGGGTMTVLRAAPLGGGALRILRMFPKTVFLKHLIRRFATPPKGAARKTVIVPLPGGGGQVSSKCHIFF